MYFCHGWGKGLVVRAEAVRRSSWSSRPFLAAQNAARMCSLGTRPAFDVNDTYMRTRQPKGHVRRFVRYTCIGCHLGFQVSTMYLQRQCRIVWDC